MTSPSRRESEEMELMPASIDYMWSMRRIRDRRGSSAAQRARWLTIAHEVANYLVVVRLVLEARARAREVRQRNAQHVWIERGQRHGAALATRQSRVVDHREVEQAGSEVRVDLPVPFEIQARLLAFLLAEEPRCVQPHLDLARRIVVVQELDAELPEVPRPVAGLHRQADTGRAFTRLHLHIRDGARSEGNVGLKVVDLLRQ